MGVSPSPSLWGAPKHKSSAHRGTGCFFFTGPPPKKLKYGKPRLG